MRVQRKHDIVQAKLKKERQQGKGGTPGAADPNPKAPPASWESRRDESSTKRREEDSSEKIGKVSESEEKGEAPTCYALDNKERCSERGSGNRVPL